MRDGEWVRFVIRFTELAPRYLDALRVISVDAYGEAPGLPRREVLGAATTWWGAPIAAVTNPQS